jgi:hypothetical protein
MFASLRQHWVPSLPLVTTMTTIPSAFASSHAPSSPRLLLTLTRRMTTLHPRMPGESILAHPLRCACLRHWHRVGLETIVYHPQSYCLKPELLSLSCLLQLMTTFRLQGLD